MPRDTFSKSSKTGSKNQNFRVELSVGKEEIKKIRKEFS